VVGAAVVGIGRAVVALVVVAVVVVVVVGGAVVTTTRPIPTTKAPFRKPFPGSNSRPRRPHFKRKNTLDKAERELLRRWLEKLLRREK
jgi:hypothetical protein